MVNEQKDNLLTENFSTTEIEYSAPDKMRLRREMIAYQREEMEEKE